MIGLWNVNWLNQNSQRSYPLSDAGNKTPELTPELRIPDDFLLALRLSVNSGLNIQLDRFFLKSIVVSGNGCTLTLGYDSGTVVYDAAVGYVTGGNGIFNCKLTGIGEFTDTVGYAAFSRECSIFTDWVGYYTFAPESTPIEPDCIVPMLRSVSSIRVRSGESLSERFYGDIELVAGTNTRIVTEKTASGARIRIDALTTVGFEESCVCDLHDEVPYIRTLQGVSPDAQGNIQILGQDCIAVTVGEHSLILADTCASPDCGCTELEALSSRIREQEDGITTMEQFVETIYSTVSATQQAVVNSETKSGGCCSAADSGTLKGDLTIIPY